MFTIDAGTVSWDTVSIGKIKYNVIREACAEMYGLFLCPKENGRRDRALPRRHREQERREQGIYRGSVLYAQ